MSDIEKKKGPAKISPADYKDTDGSRVHCHFAATTKSELSLLLDEGVDNVLVSYAFFKRGIPDEALKLCADGKLQIMLDSGGFTNFHKPGSITVEAYAEFLDEYAGKVTECVSLDDIKSKENTVKNYRFLREHGHNPMFVDHVWFPYDPDIYDGEYATGEKVCWGGMVRTPDGKVPRLHGKGSVSAAYIDRLESRLEKVRKGKKTKLHLLGVGGRLRQVLRFMDAVDSVDTASWTMVSKGYGRVSYVEMQDDGWPRLRAFKPDDCPPELLKWCRQQKLDPKSWEDRGRIAIRMFTAYWNKCMELHEKCCKEGTDLRQFEKSEGVTLAYFDPAPGDLLPVEASKSEAPPAPEENPTDADVTWQCTFVKADTAKRLVTGIVLEPDEIDLQNDTISEEEIERAAHKFLAQYNKLTKMGLMHQMFGNIGVDLVESWIAREDGSMGGAPVKKGSWLMTVYVKSDPLWRKVQDGEITGFSIGGTAKVS